MNHCYLKTTKTVYFDVYHCYIHNVEFTMIVVVYVTIVITAIYFFFSLFKSDPKDSTKPNTNHGNRLFYLSIDIKFNYSKST